MENVLIFEELAEKEISEISEETFEFIIQELNLFEISNENIKICKETFEILQMFKKINKFVENLDDSEKKQININSLQFDGFDANNDSLQFSIITYLKKEDIEKIFDIKDYQRFSTNSSIALTKYKEVLNLYKNKPLDFDLTKTISDKWKNIQVKKY